MPVPLRLNRRGPWTCRPAPLGTTANSAFRRSRMIATANAWPDRWHQNCARMGRRQTGCRVQPRIARRAAKLNRSIQPRSGRKSRDSSQAGDPEPPFSPHSRCTRRKIELERSVQSLPRPNDLFPPNTSFNRAESTLSPCARLGAAPWANASGAGTIGHPDMT